MDGVHDMGGMHGFGSVLVPDGHLTHSEAWEPRAQMVGLLAGVVSRPRIEGLDPAVYLGSTYYDRWLLAAERGAVRRGVLAAADLQRWQEALAADPDRAVPAATGDAAATELVRQFLHRAPALEPAPDARFGPGDRVRVRRTRVASHHRCPRYVKGAAGTVESVVGLDAVPGVRPGDGEVEPVYTVCFASEELWGPCDEPPFELLIDLWDRYLEPA